MLGILVDNTDELFLILSLIPITGLLAFFYVKTEKSFPASIRKKDTISVAASVLGALLTYFLNLEFDLGGVLAAGIVGLTGAMLPYINKQSGLLKEIPVAMYCGSFVGMTTPGIANGYLFILYAGLLTGMLLVLAKNILTGYGGKLGTIAFGGVSIVYSVIYLFT
ncbi:hypothetical protein NE848_13620 [Gramella jeungdoensis]|uniref:DUF368 domain-containing protein n=1 Tax=Gramella jeungdoensis TaxID=708091 RepID=A0ABT0Z3Z0_9FLAO|nr:hypothetical protein [Gramella jeungdoensis]MCM8570427.1 hypothetical protein [Gramella jeungdoensis]